MKIIKIFTNFWKYICNILINIFRLIKNLLNEDFLKGYIVFEICNKA